MNKATRNLTGCNMEIIKIDAELAECPKTGIRYFGYIKYKTKHGSYWENVNSMGYEPTSLPWFISQDHLIEFVKDKYVIDENQQILQLVILKAELPIKKMVMGNE